MLTEIGETAGRIWDELKSRGEVELARLPKILKGKSVIVYQALGWLARENKVAYRKEGDKIFVSLTL